MDDRMNEQQTNKTKIVCPVCGKEFDTQEEHDKHHREAHNENRIGQN
ncbi:MAG TPA: hypothetical protein VJ182_00430 [Anaerolineales bacterium]|nr:hypothetical protein [Anaerolineales bacterium]